MTSLNETNNDFNKSEIGPTGRIQNQSVFYGNAADMTQEEHTKDIKN
tara:strand:+ start:165 stop:305 length:141 start_codon:yes stop_codon:yes gene_type:complete